MNDVLSQSAELPSSTESTVSEVSAGALIKKAREACGLHIAALAVSLKVSVKRLEALEANDFEQLPDPVFVRALAASVCRSLKIDAASVLALLPKTVEPKLTQSLAGMRAPFRTGDESKSFSLSTFFDHPYWFLGVFLVLGAFGVAFLPVFHAPVSLLQKTPTALPASEPVVAAPQDVEVFPAGSTPVDQTVAVNDGIQAPISPLPAPNASAASAVTASLVVSAPASAPKTPAASSPMSVAQPSDVLSLVTFKAKSESWVEVSDAKKVVVLRRTLTPGQTVGASGVLPLSVVIGRADSITVEVRGKPFDLTTVAKDNVARFEVK